MNPSYFRIKLDMEKAIERLCVWNGSDYKERIETEFFKAVDVSLDENEEWKGSCLYVYENDGWTIFEDLSGDYSCIGAEQWKDYAKGNELVFAGYNDAILYAELIVIENGIVTKNFIEDYDMPEDNVNEGDGIADINDWTDVAGFVDDDELVYSDEGIVIIF